MGAVAGLEEPKKDKREGLSRVKVRQTESGSEGWLTLDGHVTRPWSSSLKCVTRQGVALTGVIGNVIRKVDFGEVLIALDAPAIDLATGIQRVRVRAEKDGVVGSMPLRT